MAGSLAACDSWFNNTASQVSAHYGVGLGGTVHQYVMLANAAWANGKIEPGNVWPGTPGVNPNYESVSIETEDDGSSLTPVSDRQYEAVWGVCALVLEQLPNVRYLTTHRAISPSSRPGCPGNRWISSGRFDVLAEALGLEPIH